jgi:hypothetical protein
MKQPWGERGRREEGEKGRMGEWEKKFLSSIMSAGPS